MNSTTTPIASPPRGTGHLQGGARTARRPQPGTPTEGSLAADLPLLGVIPFGLPSAIFLAGWVFLALALAGPFLALVVIVLASALFVGAAAAIAVVPYLLVRGLHRYRMHRAAERLQRDERSAVERAQLPSALQTYTPAQLHAVE